MKLSVEKPSYRNNGKYQFVKGWTPGGAEMCAHLSFDEIAEQLKAQAGPGKLIDDGENLWWELDQVAEEAGLI